jgi:hypothetical protein
VLTAYKSAYSVLPEVKIRRFNVVRELELVPDNLKKKENVLLWPYKVCVNPEP